MEFLRKIPNYYHKDDFLQSNTHTKYCIIFRLQSYNFCPAMLELTILFGLWNNVWMPLKRGTDVVLFCFVGAHQKDFQCDREADSRIIMKCSNREGTRHIKIHNDPKDSCCFVALHSFKSCLTRATVGSFNCQQVLVSITGDRRLLQLHLFNFFARYYTLSTNHMLSAFLY